MTTTSAISETGYTGPVGTEVVTAATTVLLDVEQVKARLRVPFADEDADLQQMLLAATQMVEDRMGRRLLETTVRWWYDAVPSGWTLWLPEPVRSVVAVKTYDEDDVEATLSSGNYYVDTRRSRITVKDTTTNWPPSDLRTTNALSVEATVGYAAATDVPVDIIEAVLLQVMALYQRDTLKGAEHAAYQQAIGSIVGKHAYRVGVA